MRVNVAGVIIGVLCGAVVCRAQNAPAAGAGSAQTTYSTAYCSGFVKDSKLPTDLRVVSGEQAGYKIIFGQPDRVYLNQGSSNGVRVGDRFMVVRQDEDFARTEWFKGQMKITRAIGTLYSDIGQLRIVSVESKTSVAEIIFSCRYMERGDIVRPFEERPLPPLKDATFDHFAAPSGKPVGTIVNSADFQQSSGQGATVYVNIGAAQGIKVGDYLRVFRYQGKMDEYAPQTRGYAYEIYGYGSSPTRYEGKDLPREVLGEGVVLNASRNSATVFLTFSSADIFMGDTVEIE
jgi:hypothetical protein